MKCSPHYYSVNLPNGRTVRTSSDPFIDDIDEDDEELGTGWSIPGKEITRYKGSSDTYRVTTTHIAALRCLLKKKMKTKLSQEKGKEALLKACTGFDVNLSKVKTDDYYAAVVWANLRNNKKLGLNIQRIAMMCLPSGFEKFVKKAGDAIGDIAKVALPIAAIVFPVLAPVLAPLAVVANAAGVVGKVKDAIDAGKKVKKAVDTVSDQVESVTKPVSELVSQGKKVANATKQVSKAAKTVKDAAAIATGTKPQSKAVSPADIKAVVANIPKEVTASIIRELQVSAVKKQNTTKVANQVASQVSSKFTPEINSILKMLNANKLQQQATLEHNAINKQKERDKVQDAILKKVASLDKKIDKNNAAKKKAQVAASFFGVPTRLL